MTGVECHSYFVALLERRSSQFKTSFSAARSGTSSCMLVSRLGVRTYRDRDRATEREREREREKETERESVELTMSQRAANFRRVQRRTKKSEEAAENEGKYVAYENNVGEKLDIDL
jgi:hypothetical protein